MIYFLVGCIVGGVFGFFISSLLCVSKISELYDIIEWEAKNNDNRN